MRPDRILETVLYVGDLDAAERFYADVLGLVHHGRKPPFLSFFRVRDGMLLLFDPGHLPANDVIPPHGTDGAGHACFAVPAAELDRWREHLSAQGVAIERDYIWPNGGRSLYFRDPAGNSLELATPRIWDLPDSEPAPG